MQPCKTGLFSAYQKHLTTSKPLKTSVDLNTIKMPLSKAVENNCDKQ